MGELFRSFDESWRHFLARTEPLESFFDEFPEEPTGALLLGWLVVPARPCGQAALEVQGALAHLDWLRPIPAHFLHVWIGGVALPADPARTPEELERGCEALAGLGPFDLRYPRLNCFHTAVVAEAEAEDDALAAAAARLFPARDLAAFLPHLTLAVVTEPRPAEPLREALVPRRNTDLGAQVVSEVTLCLVPATRETVLEPWTVVGSAALG